MIPMMQLIPYMDPSKNPGDNPELSKFMKHIFTSGEGEGFPESKLIITNRKGIFVAITQMRHHIYVNI